MSVLSAQTGYGLYKVIDDATGKEIEAILWVDDVDLEYAAVWKGGWCGSFNFQTGVSITRKTGDTYIEKVTAVSVNHTAREIHVNTPQPVVLTITVGHAKPQQGACDECCDESACQRINQCLRYRCCYGEVSKP
jgi:hypothetical protein